MCKDMFRFGVWTRDSIALGSAASQLRAESLRVEQSYPLPVQRQRKEEGAEGPPTALFEEA